MRRAPHVDLAGRAVLVTGATPGSLGAQTARILHDWGADVVVTARSDPAAAGAELGDVPARRLDLADAASVASFAAWYRDEIGRLDVLVNNAGVHLDLGKRWKTAQLVDGYEVHWRTNYLGTVHLTHLLLPLLSSASDPRVVHLVSRLHKRARNADLFQPRTPYDSWNAYGASKLALVHHAFELQRRCAPVQAYAVHPGVVYTHIADRGLEERRFVSALRRALAPLERRLLRSPEQGAQTTVLCASAPGLPGGTYYRGCVETAPSVEALDEQAGARLWDATQEWLARRE